MPFLPIALGIGSILGKIMGGAAKGSADNRRADNTNVLAQNQLTAQLHGQKQSAMLQALLGNDRAAMDRFSTKQHATQTALGQEEAGKLNRAELGLRAPGMRSRQALAGSMLANFQPRSLPGVPQIRGGAANAISPTARDAGRALEAQALEALLSGSDIPASTDFAGGVLEAPEAMDFRSGILADPRMGGYKSAGALEKILGAGGLVGSILGGIDTVTKGKKYDVTPDEEDI